ncbi:MAG TPA: hypothetical protein PK631_06850, partial [Erysipelotrichaceae bacterium]|nr:hypothetical protein [Erysipelotrichaceae bacterium]
AGKKLNNDFEVEEIIIDSAANEEETGEDGEVKKVKIYSYDKQYANKNKANKNGLVYLSVLGLMAAMVVLIVFLTTLFKNNVLMILIVVYGLLAVYIVMIVKLSPYLSAKSFQYFKKDGVIYRNSTANGIVQALNDLRVESTTEDSFICSYQKKENQRKKLIIPNSYPGLEEILKY